MVHNLLFVPVFSEQEQYFLDLFDKYSPIHDCNIWSMGMQRSSTVSRAMIYPTFSEFLQVYQHIYLIFCMYIQYAFSG